MKFVKMISALAIVMAIAIAPSSGVFAQTDVASDEISDKQIYKEERKQHFASLKEQRKDIKTQIHEFQDKRLSDHNIPDVEPTIGFNGITSGWAVIGGQAYPIVFSLDGEAGKVENRGWKLSGTGTAEIGQRNVAFDITGFAKGHSVHIKGVMQENESVVIHLRGHFAPIADSESSYALGFRGAVSSTQADVRVPLVLVGDVTTYLLDPTVDTEEKLIEPEISDSEIEDLLDDLL